MVTNLPAAGDSRDMDSMPGSGRCPGVGNIFLPENSMYRGAWLATVHGIAKKSNTTEELNNNNDNMESMWPWVGFLLAQCF